MMLLFSEVTRSIVSPSAWNNGLFFESSETSLLPWWKEELEIFNCII